MTILVIDGQGGNIGRALVREITEKLPDAELIAVGTNSIATASMLKAGARNAATGENAVLVACRRADVIAGPIGIVIADALLGEVTPAMAAAVGQSRAARVLIPVNRCDTLVAGVTDNTTASLLQDAMAKILALTAAV
ncbi:MAG: DUF3842 family protein [Candidatus Spyradocola sp.]